MTYCQWNQTSSEYVICKQSVHTHRVKSNAGNKMLAFWLYKKKSEKKSWRRKYYITNLSANRKILTLKPNILFKISVFWNPLRPHLNPRRAFYHSIYFPFWEPLFPNIFFAFLNRSFSVIKSIEYYKSENVVLNFKDHKKSSCFKRCQGLSKTCYNLLYLYKLYIAIIKKRTNKQ